jgi:gamma-glutamylcyclotransferase (GGCT)/AIG2-like uncharacterized protein YtfP
MAFNVFVYGTLRASGTNHHFLRSSTRLADVVVPKSNGLVMFNCGHGYPFLQRAGPDEEAHDVVGEIYEIDSATLAQLDRLEDIEDGLYTREELLVSSLRSVGPMLSARLLPKCFVYIGTELTRRISGGAEERMPHGDWIAFSSGVGVRSA